MGESRWTEEQREAIEARGCDILVAAAAGSGKTAVLVERIIRRITTDEPPTDIDRLLVVTFTKAAATEMSQRVGAAIGKKLGETPDNLHLQNQMTLLSRADIKTIHSFCLQIIREYYHLLDIDPSVRTADPAEMKLLQKEVIEDYFEELYRMEENLWFLQLLETYGQETRDQGLKDLVLQIYEFAQGYPEPKALLQQMTAQFHLEEGETIDHCPWTPIIRESINGTVSFALSLLGQARKMAVSAAGFDGYLERLEQEAEGVAGILTALKFGYAAWHQAYVMVDFARLPAYKGEDKEYAEEIKSLRNEAKEVVKKLGETYFCFGVEMQTALIRALYPVAQGLGRLVAGFMDAIAQGKKDKLIVDFHDYEHFCLQVLVAQGSTLENIIPTEAAKEVQQRYDEIMIDEYQDSNMVQEMILSAVSGESQGKNNRFMVGDVKQSIYRFRLAMPTLFNEKYNRYPMEAGGICRKVILSKNFRSRENVLDGANFIFRQIMREEFGEIEYNHESALYAGATFPKGIGLFGGTNELLLIETAVQEESDLPEELEEMSRRHLEAAAISEKIRQMMADGFEVVDKETGEYRPLAYGDIAILLRSIKSWGTTLEDVFGKEGIPYYAETATGYFDVAEVDTMLNVVRLIDNPRQDIPLLSVLHSPIYGLTAEELIKLRMAGGQGLFYECLDIYLEQGDEEEIKEKIRHFQKDLKAFRGMAREVSLNELLRYLYERTGYYDFVGMMAGGSLRQGNLRLLLERAEQYEQGSQKGLFFFIRYVEDLKTTEAESSSAKLQSAGENLVRVMTIHKSKGLEFPVVFVGDMGKGFNEMDTRAPVLLHQDWGCGLDYMDLEQRAIYRTLSKTALSEVIRLENLAEELRVLYVAFTRAKEKLILSGTTKNIQKSLERWSQVAEEEGERLPTFRLRRGKTYLDWVMPALLRHEAAVEPLKAWGLTAPHCTGISMGKESLWQIQFLQREDILGQIAVAQEVSKEQENIFANWDATKDYSGRKAEIETLFQWQYPHKMATTLGGKVSISEIKRKAMELLTGEMILPQIELAMPTKKREKALQTLTAAEMGTAIHTVLEAADFRQSYDDGTIEVLIDHLVKSGRLTEVEGETLPRNELLIFFDSPLAQRMRGATEIEKERPFAMLMPAKEIFLEEQYENMEDTVLINGIMDCYFMEGEKVILVDYKSDRVYEEETLKKRYEIQLNLYHLALERALGRPVTEVYLYSFAMGRAVLL